MKNANDKNFFNFVGFKQMVIRYLYLIYKNFETIFININILLINEVFEEYELFCYFF